MLALEISSETVMELLDLDIDNQIQTLFDNDRKESVEYGDGEVERFDTPVLQHPVICSKKY